MSPERRPRCAGTALSLVLLAVSWLALACDNLNNDTKLVCSADARSGAETKDVSGADAQFKLMMEWAELKIGTPEGKDLVVKLKRADMLSRAKLLRDAQATVKLDQCGLADWVEGYNLGRLHQ